MSPVVNSFSFLHLSLSLSLYPHPSLNSFHSSMSTRSPTPPSPLHLVGTWLFFCGENRAGKIAQIQMCRPIKRAGKSPRAVIFACRAVRKTRPSVHWFTAAETTKKRLQLRSTNEKGFNSVQNQKGFGRPTSTQSNFPTPASTQPNFPIRLGLARENQ
jgi:hypothetical protein